MPLIEGIGDEVTNFFIALFAVIIVTVAWWTTNISEQRHVRTVLLLERRRHRTHQHRRLTNHTEAVTITEGNIAQMPVIEEQTTVEDSAIEEPTSSIDNPPEASTSSTGRPEVEEVVEHDSREEQNILETMDADTCILRQRRLAFYNWNNSNEEPSNSQTDTFNHSAELPLIAPSAPEEDMLQETIQNEEHLVENKFGIKVKLKYINDNLRLVDGNLDESLGDFKKRHFQPELSSQKLVRLIFNGQVLQPDTQTLKNCGFFNNCVVHCLIHQKRNQSNESTVHESRREGYSFPNPNGIPNLNNNQNRDWDLGNFLFAFISFILLAAWYFRYVYAHLYTVTATVGLILITGIFTIVLVGMYFPDNEHLPNPMIRIARGRLIQQQQQEQQQQ